VSSSAGPAVPPSTTGTMMTALFYLSMLLVIAAILTAAMGFQYLNNEIPCPLCLLQRVAMFGVCFGLIANFRNGMSDRNTGWSMLFALFLLIVSARQTLIDIYPRPGHAYIGSAVFGIHMPVWSVLIATAILIAFGLKFTILGGDGERPGQKPAGTLGRIAAAASIYVIALCAINFISVVVQCGVDACHTYEYRLLK
jgi:disulfide bond formation protein DsbB